MRSDLESSKNPIASWDALSCQAREASQTSRGSRGMAGASVELSSLRRCCGEVDVAFHPLHLNHFRLVAPAQPWQSHGRSGAHRCEHIEREPHDAAEFLASTLSLCCSRAMAQQRRVRQIAASLTASTKADSKSPELIPIQYEQRCRLLESEWAAEHLRWMIQKDALGQDMFLLGPHSPLRRWLAYRFCEIAGEA